MIHTDGLSFSDFESFWAPLCGGGGDVEKSDVVGHRSSIPSPSEHVQLCTCLQAHQSARVEKIVITTFPTDSLPKFELNLFQMGPQHDLQPT